MLYITHKLNLNIFHLPIKLTATI